MKLNTLLSPFSNFCKPLKKNSESCPSNEVSEAAMTSASDEKWWPIFQSRKQVAVRWGQIWRIRWVIKTLEAQVGCKCLVSRGIVVQEQDPLGHLPMVFFLQSVLQLHQQRWVDSLALSKIIIEEDAVLIPKNWGKNFSSGSLHLEFFRRDQNDFLSRLVTIDETWIYHYDPETEQQSMEWRHSG